MGVGGVSNIPDITMEIFKLHLIMGLYPNIYCLLKIFMTLPVSVATQKEAFRN